MVSETQQIATRFDRWLRRQHGSLSPAAVEIAQRVHGRLDMLAHGGEHSPSLRSKAMADIEALCAELGMVQR